MHVAIIEVTVLTLGRPYDVQVSSAEVLGTSTGRSDWLSVCTQQHLIHPTQLKVCPPRVSSVSGWTSSCELCSLQQAPQASGWAPKQRTQQDIHDHFHSRQVSGPQESVSPAQRTDLFADCYIHRILIVSSM
jgi:hypothetical protein